MAQPPSATANTARSQTVDVTIESPVELTFRAYLQLTPAERARFQDMLAGFNRAEAPALPAAPRQRKPRKKHTEAPGKASAETA